MMVTEERYALDTYVSVAYRGRMPDDDDRRSFGFHVSRPGLQDCVVITCNVNFFSPFPSNYFLYVFLNIESNEPYPGCRRPPGASLT